MKKNEIIDLKSKTIDELKRMVLDLREEVGKSAMEKTLGKIKNTNFAKNKRKDIARVLTILSMKKNIVIEEIKKEVHPVK